MTGYLNDFLNALYNQIFPSEEIKNFRRERKKALSLVRNSTPENLWENYDKARKIAYYAYLEASLAGCVDNSGREIDVRFASDLFNNFYLFPEFVGNNCERARRRHQKSITLVIEKEMEKLKGVKI
jgi:hypothetical protein